MDQKVVCMFLLILGVSHGLQCYGGDYGTGKKNFDAATARKLACRDNEDVCQKSMYYIISNLLLKYNVPIENPQF